MIVGAAVALPLIVAVRAALIAPEQTYLTLVVEGRAGPGAWFAHHYEATSKRYLILTDDPQELPSGRVVGVTGFVQGQKSGRVVIRARTVDAQVPQDYPVGPDVQAPFEATAPPEIKPPTEPGRYIGLEGKVVERLAGSPPRYLFEDAESGKRYVLVLPETASPLDPGDRIAVEGELRRREGQPDELWVEKLESSERVPVKDLDKAFATVRVRENRIPKYVVLEVVGEPPLQVADVAYIVRVERDGKESYVYPEAIRFALADDGKTQLVTFTFSAEAGEYATGEWYLEACRFGQRDLGVIVVPLGTKTGLQPPVHGKAAPVSLQAWSQWRLVGGELEYVRTFPALVRDVPGDDAVSRSGVADPEPDFARLVSASLITPMVAPSGSTVGQGLPLARLDEGKPVGVLFRLSRDGDELQVARLFGDGVLLPGGRGEVRVVGKFPVEGGDALLVDVEGLGHAVMDASGKTCVTAYGKVPAVALARAYEWATGTPNLSNAWAVDTDVASRGDEAVDSGVVDVPLGASAAPGMDDGPLSGRILTVVRQLGQGVWEVRANDNGAAYAIRLTDPISLAPGDEIEVAGAVVDVLYSAGPLVLVESLEKFEPDAE